MGTELQTVLDVPADYLHLTEDDLPSSDGIPMETQRHVKQMNMLVETLTLHWQDRQDCFIGCDMFVYFSPDQVKNKDFRGPDVFVVQDTTFHERKSWVVWQEGKSPDVVIELMSESTATFDKTRKKDIYQDELQVPEYFLYDPFSGELLGYRLVGGVYHPIAADAQGGLVSQKTGLRLVQWRGEYDRIAIVWLRWATLDGVLLPTKDERAEQAEQKVEQERREKEQFRREHEQATHKAEQAARKAEQAEQKAEQATRKVEQLVARLRELGIDPSELN
jgi:Uma2 family endonuclease